MTALSIQPTYPIFTDIDGQPLEDGYIWLGVINLDPIANPISAYWDAAFTVPAVQPIRTRGGYPMNSGAPGRLYVNSDYSIQVQNKNGSVVYSAPAATERYNGSIISTINASQVIYDPAGSGAVATTVQEKLRETVSVTDFGAVADGTIGTSGTDNLLFFKAALEYLESQGGGTLYVPPSDGIYDVSSPIIVRSNIQLVGAGYASKIRNSVGTYTNAGDVVHIGISNEWVGWNNVGPAVTDASIAQFDAGNYSRLTTKNVIVRDIHVMTKAAAGTQGLGIWAMNATDFIIENIWASNTATPINIGNDNSISPMACRNGVVKNIFQVTSGRWYDLFFCADSEFIDVSGCFNNPTDPSGLNTAITVGGNARFISIHDNLVKFQNSLTKVGIELTGPVTVPTNPNFIFNNTVVNANVGIIVYDYANQVVNTNNLEDCGTAIRLYRTGHTVDGNVFTDNTYDFDFKSGCNAKLTNMALTFSKLTGDSAGLIAQQTYRNCWGFGGVKQRVYWGVDYVISAPDIANLTDQDARLQFTAPSTTVCYFRIPDDLYELQELRVNWYSGAAGEVLTAGLYKREAFVNANVWTQVGTTQTYTSGGVGDITSTWSGIGAVVTNVQTFQPDQYYIKFEITVADVNTQLRSSQITYNTTGTLN